MDRIAMSHLDLSFDFYHMMTAIHEQCNDETSAFGPCLPPETPSAFIETPQSDDSKKKASKSWNPAPLSKLRALVRPKASGDKPDGPDPATAEKADPAPGAGGAPSDDSEPESAKDTKKRPLRREKTAAFKDKLKDAAADAERRTEADAADASPADAPPPPPAPP